MPVVNDGSIPVNSYVVTVGSTAYVAETLDGPREGSGGLIERRDQDNEPSGWHSPAADFVTATLALQRPTSSTALPNKGDTVVMPSGALAGLTGTFYVVERGASYSIGALHRFNITVRKAV